MSFRATALRQCFFGALFLGVVSVSDRARAQAPAPAPDPNAPPPPIVFATQDAVTSSFVTPVNSGGTGGGSSNTGQWLKVEFHYSVNPAPAPNSPSNGKPQTGFLNEATFKVWIEARDPLDPASTNGEGIAVVLTGSVTYILLPGGRDAYGVFYVPPSAIARYTGERGITEFDRKYNIHVEASIAGAPVAAADKKPDNDNWYKDRIRAVPGVVFRQNQGPFINADPDRYPVIKLPESQ